MITMAELKSQVYWLLTNLDWESPGIQSSRNLKKDVFALSALLLWRGSESCKYYSNVTEASMDTLNHYVRWRYNTDPEIWFDWEKGFHHGDGEWDQFPLDLKPTLWDFAQAFDKVIGTEWGNMASEVINKYDQRNQTLIQHPLQSQPQDSSLPPKAGIVKRSKAK